jgi:hypothetical protein
MVTETIKNAVAIDISSIDWVKEDFVTHDGVLFCTVAGNVTAMMPSGISCTKAMTVGEYWRISPSKVVRATTTATVQFHW